jgi:hypothetical protein
VAPHTSDYLAAFTGAGTGGGANPNPNQASATFTLAQPAANIDGIRIVGTHGGSAGGGFLGVFELATRTPVSDSDNDGMDDAWERINGLVVGTNDGSGDADGDGLTNAEEFAAKTDPKSGDSDGDSLSDSAEVKTHLTNPLRADSDADGLSDSAEIGEHGTNPLQKDTDQDRFSDYVEVAEGTDPKSGASIPTNIASLGTGILGKKDALESGIEGEFPVFNSGSAESINDGNLNTRVDTYGRPEPFSFVGILWDQPVTQPILGLKATFALFSNGGWFGTDNLDPGAGGLLTADYLSEPLVEVTADHGQTWTAVPHTSDYLEMLLDAGIGGGSFPNPNRAVASFTLAEAARNIDGIRLVGSNGGSALGGFLGIWDLAVNVEASAVIAAPRLLELAYANGQFRFRFDSQAGATHVVEYKDRLSDAQWQTGQSIAGDGTRKEASISSAGGQRYFRLSNR